MYEESKETYSLNFRRLKERGLKKVWFVVSDAYAGLKVAVTGCFLDSCWQRCKVHFIRNILAHVGHKEIRCRYLVVGIFPSVDSYLRLVTAYFIEYADDWATSRAYIHPKAIEDQEAERKKAA